MKMGLLGIFLGIFFSIMYNYSWLIFLFSKLNKVPRKESKESGSMKMHQSILKQRKNSSIKERKRTHFASDLDLVQGKRL